LAPVGGTRHESERPSRPDPRALPRHPRRRGAPISVDYDHQSYDELVNSPRRELRIFTAREGGVEHVGADNMASGNDHIADWFADTLGGRTGARARHREIRRVDVDAFRLVVAVAGASRV
jgi:hypothetical protein